jgi:large subunit ribosomal protein L29
MKIKEIKDLNNKDIQDKIEFEKVQLDSLKLNHSISPLDNPGVIKEARRTIARLKTELRHRELNQQ